MITQTPPDDNSAQAQYALAAQSTQPIPAIAPPGAKPKKQLRLFALVAASLLIVVLFVLWRSLSPSTPTPTLTAQSFTTLASKNTPAISDPSASSTSIQVYIVGSIKHPGVYTLPSTARVYQLIQAAGGPLPDANLLQVNLAAKLSDGQEIYVSAIGEAPPILNPGSNSPSNTPSNSTLVNINTATVDDLRQQLHLSLASAQRIVTYRLEHGNFTSIDQLSQAVSKSIYDKIKNQVTVS